jgi:ATP adenylyltransferase
VTALHTLVIPKRHAPTFFDLFEPERRAINQLLDKIRAEIVQNDASVSGFNIGMNNGCVAGQTISHAHVHLIPRRQVDVPDRVGRLGSLAKLRVLWFWQQKRGGDLPLSISSAED